MQKLQQQIEANIMAAHDHYNRARAALLSLRVPGDWESTLWELRQEDIRGLNEHVFNEEEMDSIKRLQHVTVSISQDPNNGLPSTMSCSLEVGEGR